MPQTAILESPAELDDWDDAEEELDPDDDELELGDPDEELEDDDDI